MVPSQQFSVQVRDVPGEVMIVRGVLWLEGGLLVCAMQDNREYNMCCCQTQRGQRHQLMPLEKIASTTVMRLTTRHPSLLIFATLLGFLGFVVVFAWGVALIFVVLWYCNRSTSMAVKISSGAQDEIKVSWKSVGKIISYTTVLFIVFILLASLAFVCLQKPRTCGRQLLRV